MLDQNHSIQDLLNDIEDEIKKLSIPSSPANLYDPIKYMMQLGGKRIRPLLTLLCARLFDHQISKANSIAIAIAYEMFHNFTLMHDDIMDDAKLRRGQPTVHEKWNIPISILAGDTMFVKSVELLSSNQGLNNKEVLNLFLETAAKVCEGQQLDMDFETVASVSIDQYLKMIELKTAVLLGACCMSGALSSGTNQSNAKSLYDFGLNMGIAFQLQDDLLDSLGSEATFGKKIGGDIEAGKKTILYLITLKNLSPKDQASFISIMNNNDLPSKFQKVLEFYTRTNAAEETMYLMEKYFSKAEKSLKSVSGANELDLLLLVMENLRVRIS
ncbi:MAG TPA: polyprenyl synthetase family protein [Bacteroidia bacterium]|nr:polyprenyl synthetase family protein [Bacteroidia bacterium]HNT79246.1 polyprenyl synthetase family protein [Bacteroidia bacterium]